MLFLLASLGILLLGPLFYRLGRSSPALLNGIDSFVLISVGGLVSLHILPESFAEIGWTALVAAAIGLFAPALFESSLRRLASEVHLVVLSIALLGLLLHAITDGIALSQQTPLLSIAVLLHRLPEGLIIWWLLRPLYRIQVPLIALIGVALATSLGFAAGSELSSLLDSHNLLLLEPFMAGALLHVLLHRHSPRLENNPLPPIAGLGTVAAFLFLFAIHRYLAHAAPSLEESSGFGPSFFHLLLETAPALLLAYAMAGALYAFLPKASVAWMKKGTPLTQASRGVLFGLPLSICSCGVLPIYRSLVLQGVPSAAAFAFLVATPEFGLDSFLLSIPLLGKEFTLIRLFAAILLALMVGFILGKWGKSKASLALPGNLGTGPQDQNFPTRLKSLFQVGFGEMVDSTGPWILLGLAIAAAVNVHMGPLADIGWLKDFPQWLEVPVFALLGIPLYVCSSAATPLVAVLMWKGLSPGAAIAFLLTGPATNVTTFGIVAKLNDRKTALAFGSLMFFISLLLGTLINFFYADYPVQNPMTTEIHSHMGTFQLTALALLLLVFLLSILRQGPRGFISRILPKIAHG